MDEQEAQDVSSDDALPSEHLSAEVRDKGLILTPLARTVVEPTHIDALKKEITREVRRNPARVYILNMAKIVFISSGFLGMLVTLAKKFRARSARFCVCAAMPEIIQVFKASHFDRLIETAPDVEAALKD